MGILSNLEPKRVFEIFEEMCAIPHGSANTKAISDWCAAFVRIVRGQRKPMPKKKSNRSKKA